MLEIYSKIDLLYFLCKAVIILSDTKLIPLEEYSPIVQGLIHSGIKKEKRVFYGVSGNGVKSYV